MPQPTRTTDRPAVVLLHSLGTDRRLWRHQVPALAADHDVLTPEARGHGGQPWTSGPTTTDWVDDLAAALEGRGPVHLVGLSMGGLQAVAFAAAHPQAVRSLVVANSFAHLPDDVAQARVAAATAGVRDGMAAYADRYLEQTLTRRVDDADHDALRGAIASMHPQAYLQAAETTFRADLRPSLTGITAPCLVVAGELDEKTPLARSEELVAGIDGATLAVVPAAGHLSCIENPGAFTSTVRGFLHAVDADQVRGAA